MKKVFLSLVVMASAGAFADYSPGYISWNGWTVRTSEDVFYGKAHSSYPLTYLFDNDPKTAWVYSGTPDKWDKEMRQFSREHWHGNYALELCPDSPKVIDRIRIMGGYNKSPELFAKNDRVQTVEIWSGEYNQGKLIVRANLEDKMGWQDIALPARKYEKLILVFTKRYSGEVHDLCVSGIELYAKDKRISTDMPPMVIGSQGSECGCGNEDHAMKWNGWLSPETTAEMSSAAFSPDGRLIAGIDEDKHLWVYDVKTSKRVLYREILSPFADEEWGWIGSQVIKVKGKKPQVIRIPGVK